MKDGDRLVAESREKAKARDRYYRFLMLFLRGRAYTPDWLYWKEWMDAHRG